MENVSDVDVYGFKTEGNTIALHVRNSRRVRLAGSGGVGCVESPSASRATFLFTNTSHLTVASLADQAPFAAPPGESGPGDEFGEHSCVPTRYHTLRHDAFATAPLERPVVYKVTS